MNLCHLLNLAVPVKSVTTPSPSAGSWPQLTACGAVPASAPPSTSDEPRAIIVTIQTSLPDFCLNRNRMCSHWPTARWEEQSSARRQLQTAKKLYVKNDVFLQPHWNSHTGKANVEILLQKCLAVLPSLTLHLASGLWPPKQVVCPLFPLQAALSSPLHCLYCSSKRGE